MDNYKELFAKNGLLYNVLAELLKDNTTNKNKEIAQIVSWNLWQMDGLKDTTPFGITEDFMREVSLFSKEELEKTSSYCKIKDWDSDTILEYRTMKG